MQTIQQENYTMIDNFNSVYPTFQTYVGTRLDENQIPIGLISIMDEKLLNPTQLDSIQQILLAVKTRTKNEIERTRQREQLVMVKNAAIKDAQGKIKFLADMSHEIRYFLEYTFFTISTTHILTIIQNTNECRHCFD